MSEVKSARELATTIYDECYVSDSHDCDACGWGCSSLDTDKIAKLILSDRREIIEKCREEVSDLKLKLPGGFMSHVDEIYLDALSDCIDALDSVLSKIEKLEIPSGGLL